MEETTKPEALQIQVKYLDGTVKHFIMAGGMPSEKSFLEQLAGKKYGRSNVFKKTVELLRIISTKLTADDPLIPRVAQMAHDVLGEYFSSLEHGALYLYDIENAEFVMYVFGNKNLGSSHIFRLTQLVTDVMKGNMAPVESYVEAGSLDYESLKANLEYYLQEAVTMENYEQATEIKYTIDEINEGLKKMSAGSK